MTAAHLVARRSTAVILGAGGAALLVFQHAIRGDEARLSAAIIRHAGLPGARALGTAVIFPLGARFAGYSLSAGCTAAFLIAPFCFLFAGIVALAPRLKVSRAFGALAVVGAILFAVNQLRLAVIAASMKAWGFRVGYERSHVFLGTVVSTLGLVFGLVVFAFVAGIGTTDQAQP